MCQSNGIFIEKIRGAGSNGSREGAKTRRGSDWKLYESVMELGKVLGCLAFISSLFSAPDNPSPPAPLPETGRGEKREGWLVGRLIEGLDLSLTSQSSIMLHYESDLPILVRQCSQMIT